MYCVLRVLYSIKQAKFNTRSNIKWSASSRTSPLTHDIYLEANPGIRWPRFLKVLNADSCEMLLVTSRTCKSIKVVAGSGSRRGRNKIFNVLRQFEHCTCLNPVLAFKSARLLECVRNRSSTIKTCASLYLP